MLSVRDVTTSLGGQRILDGISVDVAEGRLGVLFGPNGAGKSTLFRCIIGAQKHTGEVSIDGESIRSWRTEAIARAIAYVPQDHATTFSFLVRDIVLMGRNPQRGGVFGPRTSDVEAAHYALERLSLLHLADRSFTTLSGGQRQLVLIARALAQNARFLLFDEPTASLDFGNQMLVWETIRSLVDEGHGALVCTHDPNHALWFADDAVVLNKRGSVLATGGAADVIDAARVNDLYACAATLGMIGLRRVVVPGLVKVPG
ncbi:ABC transporter ATP-binding protein [Hoyosella rhizosphaerae]|uniref:ABC transporter ATP-binding protein n=1 Tax=Hoyosella rhizosphaerae TaxID=1755582 RepID=A0A916XA50_9ACTN|nr:ABC transporter ATP-binding protein [Hoyosella rhizosphaerae]MBN4926950.1 ABC transporter ATP-binding protein [Hoyosella rhizosphaerae]GGC55233.1 ABC transporter ATP-binding protein [Hoyosella rhizosphaerae]